MDPEGVYSRTWTEGYIIYSKKNQAIDSNNISIRSDLHSEIFRWNRDSSQISCQVVKADKTAKLVKEGGGDGVDKIGIDDSPLLMTAILILTASNI